MKKIKIFILLILFIILGFGIFNIIKNIKAEQSEQSIKEELIDIADIPEIPSEEPEFKIDFNELKKINSDIVGWIVIDETQINYPIVQSKDNSYYLNRSYEKKWSGYGSIFMDYRAASDFSSYNTFIYGHHTKNGSMFGELYKYMDKTFYENHRNFNLYTPTGNYVAQVFSAYVDSTTSDSYIQDFSSQEEFEGYIKLVKGKSLYDTDVEFDYSKDKIITLYSCSHNSNRQKTDRYFIHAVLKSV